MSNYKTLEQALCNDGAKKAFGEKLAHYATRPPKQFLQLDAFYIEDYDAVMPPDKDGDAIMTGGTVELMYGSCVRVLIPYDTDRRMAVRQLRKIAKHLDDNPFIMKNLEMPPLGSTDDCEAPF